MANPQSKTVLKGTYSWSYESDGETIVQHVTMTPVESQILGYVNTLAAAYGDRILTRETLNN
ncbi:hypothetical protein J7356_21100, partial [Xanthomonas phaseoli pv. dieffenbachiae]|nr:hypothetical protein [Xanthomonas phaseoli pv. dieffenbachiae]